MDAPAAILSTTAAISLGYRNWSGVSRDMAAISNSPVVNGVPAGNRSNESLPRIRFPENGNDTGRTSPAERGGVGGPGIFRMDPLTNSRTRSGRKVSIAGSEHLGDIKESPGPAYLLRSPEDNRETLPSSAIDVC